MQMRKYLGYAVDAARRCRREWSVQARAGFIYGILVLLISDLRDRILHRKHVGFHPVPFPRRLLLSRVRAVIAVPTGAVCFLLVATPTIIAVLSFAVSLPHPEHLPYVGTGLVIGLSAALSFYLRSWPEDVDELFPPIQVALVFMGLWLGDKMAAKYSSAPKFDPLAHIDGGTFEEKAPDEEQPKKEQAPNPAANAVFEEWFCTGMALVGLIWWQMLICFGTTEAMYRYWQYLSHNTPSERKPSSYTARFVVDTIMLLAGAIPLFGLIHAYLTRSVHRMWELCWGTSVGGVGLLLLRLATNDTSFMSWFADGMLTSICFALGLMAGFLTRYCKIDPHQSRLLPRVN